MHHTLAKFRDIRSEKIPISRPDKLVKHLAGKPQSCREIKNAHATYMHSAKPKYSIIFSRIQLDDLRLRMKAF